LAAACGGHTAAELTRRESAIAELMAEGLPNPAIAERLNLSPKTVANYVSTILLKVGVTDRQAAARIVRSWRDRA
jgi:DNA-binding NarL/FixJ family response regulator